MVVVMSFFDLTCFGWQEKEIGWSGMGGEQALLCHLPAHLRLDAN